MNQGEIIIYQAIDQVNFQIDVRVENETVWLTQNQMVDLFNATKQNISLHINNIFKEGELTPDETVREYLTVQLEGMRKLIIYRNQLAFRKIVSILVAAFLQLTIFSPKKLLSLSR